MDLINLEKAIKTEKRSTTLNQLFKMWLNFFYSKILTIFRYDGLTFPQRELESVALISGLNYAAYHDKNVGVVTGNGNVYGITRYPDVFTNVVYAMPDKDGQQISGDRIIGQDACVLYNTSSMMGMYTFLARYASLMTHADLTLKCSLVNMRDMDTFLTADSSAKESMELYYKKKYNGEMSAVLDETLLMAENDTTINLSKGSYNYGVREVVDVELEILRAFYRDIGVRWIKDKRANINSEEVDSDEQLLLFNISDMLQCRKDFCDEYNRIIAPKIGNKKISVSLSPEFDIINKGGNNIDKEN